MREGVDQTVPPPSPPPVGAGAAPEPAPRLDVPRAVPFLADPPRVDAFLAEEPPDAAFALAALAFGLAPAALGFAAAVFGLALFFAPALPAAAPRVDVPAAALARLAPADLP